MRMILESRRRLRENGVYDSLQRVEVTVAPTGCIYIVRISILLFMKYSFLGLLNRKRSIPFVFYEISRN